MSHTTHTLYVMHLSAAAEAVRRRDRAAAMFCLKQAMACANKAHDDTRYRRAVLRAMNYARCI
jgi:hypothetical protein